MSEFVNLKIGSSGVSFYIYVNTPNSRQKVLDLESYFRRMPMEHLRVLYPIVIMNHKAGGRDGGGTWTATEVPTNFARPGHERNTGVPNADIQNIFREHGSRGLIGISKDRWERPIGRLIFTIFHEVSHCIQSSFNTGGLVASGLRLNDLNGMTERECRSGLNAVTKRMLAVYTHAICAPSQIYHNRVSGETANETNARMLGHLRRSPAFRTVLQAWSPT